MTTLKTIAAFVLLCCSLVTVAQNTSTTTGNSQSYIEVVGTAEKEIVPDEIYISIVLKERYDNRIKVTIESQEERLKAALQSIGIPMSDLAVSDANADYVKVKWQQKDVLTKKDYLLKVSNATMVGKVFQQLDELNINDARIARISHSKLDSLKKEVRIQAIKAAKEKADYLLNEIGEQTGKALIVTENTPINTLPQRNVNSVNNMQSNVNSNLSDFFSTEIQFQKIKLSSSIYVKFAIK